jgi:predicted ABC-type ATPase
MSPPKLRMVAGPNGSGKSTLLDDLRGLSFPLGYCLNPDTVEKELVQSARLDLGAWGLRVEEALLRSFIQGHPLGSSGTNPMVSVAGDVLTVRPTARLGYFAAMLCDFMRRQWVREKQTFTFETVMSAPDKVELLREALGKGYRTYLYYVCTDSVIINRERVKNRVLQGGHEVPEEKIESRYHRSLKLLPEAIRQSSRSYLFDNSGKAHRLIAEFERGRLMALSKELPAWLVNAGVLPTESSDG